SGISPRSSVDGGDRLACVEVRPAGAADCVLRSIAGETSRDAAGGVRGGERVHPVRTSRQLGTLLGGRAAGTGTRRSTRYVYHRHDTRVRLYSWAYAAARAVHLGKRWARNLTSGRGERNIGAALSAE